MDGAAIFRRTAAGFNKAMLPVLDTGPGRRLFGSSFAVITYRGRKSGREFTLPVNYRREKKSGDLLVGVAAPNAKTWWRNFTDDGADVTVRLGGATHAGHATATRGAKGGVGVRITLAQR